MDKKIILGFDILNSKTKTLINFEKGPEEIELDDCQFVVYFNNKFEKNLIMEYEE